MNRKRKFYLILAALLVNVALLSSAGPAAAQAGPEWNFDSVISFGCGTSATGFNVSYANVGPAPYPSYYQDTIVTSGGQVYMDEYISPGIWDTTWYFYNKNDRGLQTTTFPIPAGQPITFTMTLRDYSTEAALWVLTVVMDGCDTGNIVSVTSGPPNSPPVANDDSASTSINTAVDINVATNDSDPDGNLVLSSVSVISGPSSGSAVSNVAGPGIVTYSPNSGFHGTDTFDYEICDLGGLCDTATVTVEVTPGGGGAGGGPPGGGIPGERVPDNPSGAGGHANEHACDNPAEGHRPDNIPPCREP